jgi:hypothetical protein
MKTYFKILLSLFVIALLALSVTAGSPVHFAVGGKYWITNWTNTYTNYDGETVTTDPVSGNMYGGTLSIKSGKLGVSGSFLLGSGWKWEDSWDEYLYYEGYPEPDHYYGSYSDKLKRTDIILTASYNLIPQLGLFAGYKSSVYNETYYDEETYEWYDEYGNYDPYNSWYYYYDAEFKTKGNGPGAGLALTLPVTQNKKLSAFGSLGYFNLGQDLDTDDTIIEGGLNYVLGGSIILTGSYRYEAYEKDVKIQGISAGLSFFK